jgi:hypothetical protein
MFSEYYEKEIDSHDFDSALILYHEWCERENEKPEIESDADIDDVTVYEMEHVIYHAEIMGFEV